MNVQLSSDLQSVVEGVVDQDAGVAFKFFLHVLGSVLYIAGIQILNNILLDEILIGYSRVYCVA